jgi:hypothetical protein
MEGSIVAYFEAMLLHLDWENVETQEDFESSGLV